MSKEKEIVLYEPIRKALLDHFEPKGLCELWVTAEIIPDEVQSFINRDALMVIQREKCRPDIMGYIQEMVPLPILSKRIIIADIKLRPPKIESIYQVKMYAEILSAYYAFLIMETRFDAISARFLQNNNYVFRFGKENNQIAIMYYLNDGILEFDRRFNIWNPFDTSLF